LPGSPGKKVFITAVVANPLQRTDRETLPASFIKLHDRRSLMPTRLGGGAIKTALPTCTASEFAVASTATG